MILQSIVHTHTETHRGRGRGRGRGRCRGTHAYTHDNELSPTHDTPGAPILKFIYFWNCISSWTVTVGNAFALWSSQVLQCVAIECSIGIHLQLNTIHLLLSLSLIIYHNVSYLANTPGEHTPEATLYECGGLENADLFLMSGEHTPEVTLYECGGLDNADLVLMSGPASWCFPIPKSFLEVSAHEQGSS